MTTTPQARTLEGRPAMSDPTTAPTLAWHGNPALKDEAVARMRRHRTDDTFVQGLYARLDPDAANLYRGCFHGCLTSEKLAEEQGLSLSAWLRDLRDDNAVSWHAEGERIWGIDRPVGHLLDRCFEGVPAAVAGDFAVGATEAIPVGADLSLVVARLMLDLLADDDGEGAHGVLQYTAAGSAQRAAVDAVVALYRRKLAGDEPTYDEWLAARNAADAAAAAAAAADAAAAYAAADAAAAAAYAAAAYAAAAYAAAAYAAAYAADAADAADARTHRYQWIAERLIHHLTTAPVVP